MYGILLNVFTERNKQNKKVLTSKTKNDILKRSLKRAMKMFLEN
jgi:hypothetical protein